jgi:hypothetical protein
LTCDGLWFGWPSRWASCRRFRRLTCSDDAVGCYVARCS